NIFNYGHVGKFEMTRERTYDRFVASGPDAGYYQEATEAVTGVYFTPSETNPLLAAQTLEYFNTYERPEDWQDDESYRNLFQVQQGGGLRNGDVPTSVYNIWSNIGTPYNYFGKTENDQFRITGSGSVNIGDHSISLGFEYEQRWDRGWTSGQTVSGISNGPMGIWSTARLYANSHISELDPSSADTVAFNSATQKITYDRLNSGYAHTHGGVFGGAENGDVQTFFDYNVRK